MATRELLRKPISDVKGSLGSLVEGSERVHGLLLRAAGVARGEISRKLRWLSKRLELEQGTMRNWSSPGYSLKSRDKCNMTAGRSWASRYRKGLW